MPMTKFYTLNYVMNDLHNPSQNLYELTERRFRNDEYMLSLLNILEIDPGMDLVAKTLERIK